MSKIRVSRYRKEDGTRVKSHMRRKDEHPGRPDDARVDEVREEYESSEVGRKHDSRKYEIHATADEHGNIESMHIKKRE